MLCIHASGVRAQAITILCPGLFLTVYACYPIGQLFILHTIKTFGALIFAAVMTTRQFLSILVSSFLFGNPLSEGQWWAITLALFLSHRLPDLSIS